MKLELADKDINVNQITTLHDALIEEGTIRRASQQEILLLHNIYKALADIIEHRVADKEKERF